MPTRQQVLTLLERGHSFETAARALAVPPGLVFMIATGLPADDPDAPGAAQLTALPGVAPSPQQLVSPPAYNPTRNERVLAWVRQRAARELAPAE